MYAASIKLELSAHSDRTLVITKKHRSAFTSLKRYFSIFPTQGVEGADDSSLGPVAVVYTVRMLCLVGSAVCGAMLGLIGKAFRSDELS